MPLLNVKPEYQLQSPVSGMLVKEKSPMKPVSPLSPGRSPPAYIPRHGVLSRDGGHKQCHIEHGSVLIYNIEEKPIIFERTVSQAEL